MGAENSNLGHKRDWFLSVEGQQRLGRGLLGRSSPVFELHEHGLEPVAAPSAGGRPIDVGLERQDLARDWLRKQRRQRA